MNTFYYHEESGQEGGQDTIIEVNNNFISGIDEDGNTANFVETESIMRIDNYYCSHLQIRGSVPIYWH